MARSLVLLLVLAGLLSGCGAHSPRVLDERYSSIHIAVFDNQTYEIALEEGFTRSMIEAFQRDGRLRIEPASTADLEMEAVIDQAIVTPLTYTDLDRAVGFHIDVQVLVTVTDSAGNKILNERPFRARGVYQLSNEPAQRNVLNVSDQLAEQVLSYLIEGW